MRLINWNIERRKPASWQASSLLSEIAGYDPDLVCLTEAHEGSTVSLGGYEVSARGVCWASNYAATERKVLLWSRNPWERMEIPIPLGEIGGAVAGVTNVEDRPLRVLGVCIPYQHASPYGVEPRSKYFAEHERYLEALARWFRAQALDLPSIVVGDFNRGIPRDWGPHRSYDLLVRTFAGYCIATEGLACPDKGRTTIDHVAISPSVVCLRVVGLSARDKARDRPRSDHSGVLADLALDASRKPG